MGIVITVPCRSYSAQAFDGCPACLDAALDAVAQAGLYLLGRAAPSLSGTTAGRIEVSYRLVVRLYNGEGALLASDEMLVDQSVEGVLELTEEVGAEAGLADEDAPETSMRLDDFQTTIDNLELAPTDADGVCGSIDGNLFGFSHLIGRFAIAVGLGSPSRN